MRVCVCVRASVHVHVRVYVLICMCMYQVCMYIRTCARMYLHARIRALVCACSCERDMVGINTVVGVLTRWNNSKRDLSESSDAVAPILVTGTCM